MSVDLPSDLPSVPERLRTFAAGARVLEVADSMRRAGARAVLVGGAVRDALLEQEVKDLDVEVFGLTGERLEAELARFGDVISVGRAFGVLRLRGLDVDFSLPRRDSKVAPGHRGFDVDFDPDLDFETASRRRDLTINSMGIDLATGELLDPHGGRTDLAAKLLRATDPATFGEDPLRAVRVAQMAARFEMEVDPALLALCADCDLSELPGERIYEELRKLLLKGRTPSRGFEFLRDSGLLRFFPEIEALIGVAQDPVWHPEGDVFVHTLMCLDRAVELHERANDDVEAMMFGVLCHDFGKPATSTTIDGRVRALGHDRAGCEPTARFLERLRVSNELQAKVVALVEHHLAPASLVEQASTAKAWRRLARRLAPAGVSLRLLECVARADHLGRTTEDAVARRFPAGDIFLARADELEVAREAPADVVQGRHLIARGLEPGARFGEILERCRETQDETGLRDPDAILARVLRS